MTLPVFDTIALDQPAPHVLRIRFNRPDVANALNTAMARDVLSLFQGLILDPQDWRCLILTGAGDKAFCAGGDLKERHGMTDAAWQAQHVLFEQAFYALMDSPVPVIAAVNGAAYGGGCEFALACDFIHAAETARFALTETRLGIIPGCGGTQNLPRAVGVRRARELILTGRPFSAREAADWGMVNRVVPLGDLEDSVLETAAAIAAGGPIAVRQARRAMGLGIETDLKTGLALEVEAYNRTIPTADRREGVAAFNEKRPAVFRGE
ncbi:enoyl-CoA hydratase/carnithine racemase [Caulobacter ginsengisoli]|uniref:Enoyl-CoA hydratase/carnithine racemase n=1 Tax=Caulobacter ginsengisoli TaxID=400775 RepID=A0ABU0IU56_9CAUL|nr:enoyl-CoA hydratase-related protein [Caulobacter ginsengisoli]MDQ0464564.1 enoyl-CoA hydratase/carnithine racemase [Caulobacter ginsengisoli]